MLFKFMNFLFSSNYDYWFKSNMNLIIKIENSKEKEKIINDLYFN